MHLFADDPLGDVQVPTEYSQSGPSATTTESSNFAENPLPENNEDIVRIADPLLPKNARVHDLSLFSTGVGEFSSVVKNVLQDKELNRYLQKTNMELNGYAQKSLQPNVVDMHGSRYLVNNPTHNPAPSITHKPIQMMQTQNSKGPIPSCEPVAKSIFTDCKKKRDLICAPEGNVTRYLGPLITRHAC